MARRNSGFVLEGVVAWGVSVGWKESVGSIGVV